MKAENRILRSSTSICSEYYDIMNEMHSKHRQLYEHGKKLIRINFSHLDDDNILFVFEYEREKIASETIKIYITPVIRIPFKNFGTYCVKYYRYEERIDVYKI